MATETPIQIRMEAAEDQVLYKEGYETKTLWELLQQKFSGRLQFPPHQRGEVWTTEKRNRFIGRILEQRPIPGVFLTYQIRGAYGLTPRFLNDGSQRLRTVQLFFENYKTYGISEARAIDLLEAQSTSVQHFVYNSPGEAYRDFVDVNFGTLCTAYEAAQGILTYMPLYDTVWKARLEQIHKMVKSYAAIATGKSEFLRETEHKYMRDDFFLFYKFISEDAGHQDAQTGRARLAPNEVTERPEPLPEFKLRGILLDKTTGWADESLSDFKQFIAKETQLIMDIWELVLSDTPNLDKNFKITMTLYRWLLSTAIWRRNNNINRTKYRIFLEAVIRRSQGSPTIADINSSRIRVNLALGRMSAIWRVREILKADLGPIERTYRSRSQVADGRDWSHKLSISENGEGEVFLENAADNRSRGARPAPSSI